MATSPVEEWLDIKAARGCLAETRDRYRRIVLRSLRALRRLRAPTNPRQWTAREVELLRRDGGRTRWAYGILDDFARFHGSQALSQAARPAHPTSNRVRWLSRSQAEAMIRVSRNDPLLALIVMLGIGQGLRRVEWRRLKIGDVDLANRRMLVRGKGRGAPKLVWMPLHPGFPPIWARYLRYRARLAERCSEGPASDAAPALVHARRGELVEYSLSGLDAKIRSLGRGLGHEFPDLRLSSHMLRRSGATLLEEAMLATSRRNPNGTYRVLQTFLRHENLATTMKYLQENPGRQRRAMEQFHALLPWRPQPGLANAKKRVQRIPA